MQRIAKSEERIRGFVNDHMVFEHNFKAHPDEWNVLTVAMDTLGDSVEALEYFEQHGFGDTLGERYLRFYGTFQALILQQDAIRELYRIFCEKPLSEPSAWSELRELRNLATGHPLDKRGTKHTGRLRVFVSRHTISPDGFDLIVCEERVHRLASESVDLRSPYTTYKEEVLLLLAEVEAAQRRRWPEAR